MYNKGEKTFYNQTSLVAKCDQGLIKSSTKILCIVPKGTDPLDNKLVTFNFQTGKKDTVYSSPNLLGSINLIDSTIYIGEYNLISKKSYITVDGKTTEVPTQVDIVYLIKDKVYYATLKRSEQKQESKFYEISKISNKPLIQLSGKGEILLAQ